MFVAVDIRYGCWFPSHSLMQMGNKVFSRVRVNSHRTEISTIEHIRKQHQKSASLSKHHEFRGDRKGEAIRAHITSHGMHKKSLMKNDGEIW